MPKSYGERLKAERERLWIQGATTGSIPLLLIPPPISEAPTCPQCQRPILTEDGICNERFHT